MEMAASPATLALHVEGVDPTSHRRLPFNGKNFTMVLASGEGKVAEDGLQESVHLLVDPSGAQLGTYTGSTRGDSLTHHLPAGGCSPARRRFYGNQ